MRITRRTYAAITLGLLSVFFAVDVAEAKWRLARFAGTRSQVHAACVGDGRSVYDSYDKNGVGITICIDSIRNTGVVCGSEGRCIGSYFKIALPTVPGTYGNKGSLSTPNDGTQGTRVSGGPIIF